MAKTTDTITTLDNLAACAKRSRPSPYKLYQAGKTPGTKVGFHWRFHKDVINAQREELIGKIEKQMQQSTSVLPIFSARWGIR